MNWYVLYVKSQTEKKTAAALERLDIEVFCPTRTEIRIWSDRKKKIEVPLFKSYVFVKLTEAERNTVFEVSGVVRYLFWLNKPAIVRDEEIEIIKRWLDDDDVADLNISKYAPGDRLEITKGVFKGQEAVVDKIGSKKLRLVIKSLGVIVEAKYKDLVF